MLLLSRCHSTLTALLNLVPNHTEALSMNAGNPRFREANFMTDLLKRHVVVIIGMEDLVITSRQPSKCLSEAIPLLCPDQLIDRRNSTWKRAVKSLRVLRQQIGYYQARRKMLQVLSDGFS